MAIGHRIRSLPNAPWQEIIGVVGNRLALANAVNPEKVSGAKRRSASSADGAPDLVTPSA